MKTQFPVSKLLRLTTDALAAARAAKTKAFVAIVDDVHAKDTLRAQNKWLVWLGVRDAKLPDTADTIKHVQKHFGEYFFVYYYGKKPTVDPIKDVDAKRYRRLQIPILDQIDKLKKLQSAVEFVSKNEPAAMVTIDSDELKLLSTWLT